MCNERTRQMYIKKSRLVTIGIRSKSVIGEVSKKLSDNASDIFPRLLQRYLSILSKPEKKNTRFYGRFWKIKWRKELTRFNWAIKLFQWQITQIRSNLFSDRTFHMIWVLGSGLQEKSIPPFCKQLPNLTKLILAITNCMKRFLTILTHFIELLEYPGNQPTFFNLCDSKGFC